MKRASASRLRTRPRGLFQSVSIGPLCRRLLESMSDADVAAAVDYARGIKVYPLSQAANSTVFDLDAGPVTITLPDAGKRFRSMQVINEDQYTQAVNYDSGSYTLSRDELFDLRD